MRGLKLQSATFARVAGSPRGDDHWASGALHLAIRREFWTAHLLGWSIDLGDDVKKEECGRRGEPEWNSVGHSHSG